MNNCTATANHWEFLFTRNLKEVNTFDGWFRKWYNRNVRSREGTQILLSCPRISKSSDYDQNEKRLICRCVRYVRLLSQRFVWWTWIRSEVIMFVSLCRGAKTKRFVENFRVYICSLGVFYWGMSLVLRRKSVPVTSSTYVCVATFL